MLNRKLTRAGLILAGTLTAALCGACTASPAGVRPATQMPPAAEDAGTPAATQAAGAALTPAPTKIIVDAAKVPNCLNEKTKAFGLGLKNYLNEAEAKAALGDVMLWPDPATLPENTHFNYAYFNAGQQGAFTQSTIGLHYIIGDVPTPGPTASKPQGPPTPDNSTRELDIVYMSQILPFLEPKEEHGVTTVRGGKTAYTFKPPFRPTMRSIQWKEDCRLASVIGDLPEEDVKNIAERLRFLTPPPAENP